MIIGVDAGALSVTDDRLKVGVYRVTLEALKELIRIDTENEYRLYSFGREIGVIGEIREIGGERVKDVRLPKKGWSKVWLPMELSLRPVDVYLGMAQVIPKRLDPRASRGDDKQRSIGFIYDLGFLYQPEAYGKAASTLQKQTEDLIRRADHIITISHATKADILSQCLKPSFQRAKLGFEPTVAYPGADARFSPAGEKYEGERPYFLFVGSLNKAKDIPTLLEAFAKFLKTIRKNTHYTLDSRVRGDDKKRSGDDKYDLYLIGGEYWPDPAIEETIERLHLKDRVKRLGVVPDEELPKYYRGATAFVTTALREGFCLPAAEAMACGTPVVALGRGALGEIVGEGGIVTTNLQEAMRKMMDKNIRAKYSKKAIIQAKKYRWEKFAEHIRSVTFKT